jgi:apolipoprotein N-acyltransferase
MVRGTEPVVFDVAAGTLGSVISFEGAFARELRASARLGAQLITVNTNESSYGETAASDQLLGMTRVGAAENGVAIVHAAISGKSALIMPDGSLRETTGLFEQTSLSGLAPWSSARRTLYTRWGDWVQVLAMAVIPVGLLVRKKKRRQDYLFAPPPERRIL